MSEAPKRPRRRKAAPAPTTPDPIEIAMEAEASGMVPVGFAQEVLRRQSMLIGWQIANERIGFVLRAMTGLVGLLAALALGAMAWTAHQADGLVVEAFAVPSDLARQGMVGTAVASAVLDQLARLDRESNAAQSLAITDGWSAQSRVVIPQTGVSLDEVDRLLRRWLGHETHITGEVSLTAAGVAISARASGGSTVTIAGAAGDLTVLAAGVAEQLLAQARPVEYGRLLHIRGQTDAAIRAYIAVVDSSESQAERAQAHRNLGGLYLIQNRNSEAAVELREAIRLGAQNARLVLAYVEHALGHNQVAAEQSALAVADDRRRRGDNAVQRAWQLANTRMHHALLVGAYQSAERLVVPALAVRARGGYDVSQRQDYMDALIGLHRTSDARRETPEMQRDSRTGERAESFRIPLMVKAAAADHDWTGVLQTLDTGTVTPAWAIMDAPTGDPWRALALARLGRLAEAQALAATLPRDCYRCLRIRGEVAEVAGDRRGADSWFAEAIRQNPALPFAQTDWGRVRLARGDIDGALKLAAEGHARTADFADPLELWAEALLAKGDAKAAAAKFAQAEALAPRWGRLHLKWGEALAKQGKADEARAKWRAAASMDLSPTERATLKAHGV